MLYYHIQSRPRTMIVGPTRQKNSLVKDSLDSRQIPPQILNSAAWVVGLASSQKDASLSAWNSHQRQMPRGTLNSSTGVAYRAHGLANSVSKIIMKHQHGLVTDCHHLPMVPIVPQSAQMVSVADVSVKL